MPALGIQNLRFQALSSPVGAGIMLAVAQAHEAVTSGRATHVLTYFGVDWGSFGSGPSGIHGAMDAKREVEYPVGFGGPQLYFATMATRYAADFGLSRPELEDLLGGVAVAARRNALRHEHAQLRRDLSLDEYRAEEFFAEPLRRSDISLLSDGAVAILVSAEGAVRPERRGVEIAAWAHRVQSIPDQAFYTQSRDLPAFPATTAVADEIERTLGASVASAGVLELYDCFSVATVVQLEALGVTKPGQTAALVADGALEIGGERPTNTHGGLLAHGYLLGASHVAEAVRQLRHDAAGTQVEGVDSAFVGAGPGRQYTGLYLRRTDA
ncbi:MULTISPECIES: thiolase family protein [unclassified Nocardioides]|uniref:thiolase family protein n=1 Tax=unclassified Nocardioides TaxID=2615069 RepID=UPI00190FC403|nr:MULTISPECIES: thiolase family protein [unclassified Nocardioides]